MKPTIEIVKYANIGAFCALTLACLRQWRGRSDSSIRWAAAAFGSLPPISLIGLALQQPVVSGLFIWFIQALLIVLLLFPYCLYRFATAFQPPSWIAALAARASTAVVVVWTLGLPYFPLPGAPEPRWWSLYRIAILVQWTILFAIVAKRLWGAARHEASVARLRMRTLALAATGMNAATLLSGVARVPKAPALVLVAQVLFLVSSILFFAGLTPPQWLLRIWRRPEEEAMQTAVVPPSCWNPARCLAHTGPPTRTRTY